MPERVLRDLETNCLVATPIVLLAKVAMTMSSARQEVDRANEVVEEAQHPRQLLGPCLRRRLVPLFNPSI